MITYASKSADILREMREDYSKAIYWFKKQNGGESKYEQMRDELNQRAMKERANVSSDVVYYTSPNKNNWVIFESSVYYKDIDSVFCLPYAVCYYKTEKSVCAFTPMFSQAPGDNTIHGVFIYTDHFFSRLGERLGFELNNDTIIRNFIRYIPVINVTFPHTKGKNELEELYVTLPGSVAKGYIRKCGYIFEIRTFLTNKELRPSQYKATDFGRQMFKKFEFAPNEIMTAKTMLSKDPSEEINKQVDYLIAAGYKPETIDALFNISVAVNNVFFVMGIINPYDFKQMSDHGNYATPLILEFIKENYQGNEYFPKYVQLASSIAKLDGCRKLNKNEFSFHTLTKIFGWNNDDALNVSNALYPTKTTTKTAQKNISKNVKNV